jgi:hypothetical protein
MVGLGSLLYLIFQAAASDMPGTKYHYMGKLAYFKPRSGLNLGKMPDLCSVSAISHSRSRWRLI